MRILAITDHATHGEGESIYALLKSIAGDRRCESVCVASRYLEVNNFFFMPSARTDVMARYIDDNFQYSESRDWFRNKLINIGPDDFDVLFIRLDRPVSDKFLDSLSMRFPSKLIINNPEGIRITASKYFLLRFPNLCPSMRLCENIQDIKSAILDYPIVLKPLDGYGGKGLIRIDGNRVWDGLRETFFDDFFCDLDRRLKEHGPMLAMKYLKNVHLGDKRVVVVNGKVLGAMIRFPKKGSWLANMTQGGTTDFCDITSKEYAIADEISPTMKEHGVPVFGFDTLTDDNNVRMLSEINTLNVGGFLQAEQHSGQPVVSEAAKGILAYADKKLSA